MASDETKEEEELDEEAEAESVDSDESPAADEPGDADEADEPGDADEADEPESAEPAEADESGEAKEPGEADEPEPSPWSDKVRLAHELWEAGDNARLRGVVADLAGAPAEETEARAVAADYGKRLRPDPVAIALWALSLGAFCLITYLFVLR